MSRSPRYELFLPDFFWRGHVRSTRNRPSLQFGLLNRDPRRDPVGLLMIKGLPEPVTGPQLPAMTDWLAWQINSSTESPHELLKSLQPQFEQTLIILQTGIGHNQRRWRGWVWHRGDCHPLDRFRVIGPGMISAGIVPETTETVDRDSRIRGALGAPLFEKIQRTKVSVVGCSRTGSIVAGQLAALGIRELTLIDGDNIEAHNLDGLQFAHEEQIGQNKAVVVGQHLVRNRKDILVRAWPRSLQGSSIPEAMAGSDLIVTCVDQDSARINVAQWARKSLVPHLDIGTGVTMASHGERQMAADVRLLLPGSGCVSCVGGLNHRDEAEYARHAPRGAYLPRGEWQSGGRLGSLITLNQLAASTAVQLWLDLNQGSCRSVWARLLWKAGRGLETMTAEVAPGEKCEICR